MKSYNDLKEEAARNQKEFKIIGKHQFESKKKKDGEKKIRRLHASDALVLMKKKLDDWTKPRLDERLKKFISFIGGTENAKALLLLLPKGVTYKLQKGVPKVQAVIKLLMTKGEIPFEVVDVPVLNRSLSFDRDDFYLKDMKSNAVKFHDAKLTRLLKLGECYNRLLDIWNLKGGGISKEERVVVVGQFEKIIIDCLKVPLPWHPIQIVNAIDDPTKNHTYLQMYLCPLRDLIGKSPGSKTGELLSKVEDPFFKGIYIINLVSTEKEYPNKVQVFMDAI